MRVLTRAEVETLALTPAASADLSSSFDAPYLLIDASTPGGAIRSPDCEAVAAWILRQPRPVIAAVGAERAGAAALASDALSEACDVVVGRLSEAANCIAHIERSPLAALVLVQVLRQTSSLTIQQALLLESLAFSTLQAGPEFHAWLAHRPSVRSSPNGCIETGPPVLIGRQGNQLHVRLNRPARRNAISAQMRDALVEAFALVVADDSVECARVSGSGACFSSGGDLDEFGTTPDAVTAHLVRTHRLPAAILAQCAERVHFHVHGACVGAGVELPAFGARVTAAPGTSFQLPEIRFGLIPGAGGCVSIPRRIGRQRAAFLALSAQRIDDRTALEWGLIDAIVG